MDAVVREMLAHLDTAAAELRELACTCVPYNLHETNGTAAKECTGHQRALVYERITTRLRKTWATPARKRR